MERSGSGRVWKVSFLAVLAVAALVFAYHLRAIFMPVLVALLLAYVLNPLLNLLERRKVPRLASIAGIYVFLSAVIAALALWAIPAGLAQGREFVHQTFTAEDAKIKGVMLWGGTQLQDWLGAENMNQVIENLRRKLTGHEGELAKAGGTIVGTLVSVMTRSAGNFIAVVSFVALVPVYLFFLLKNMNPWWEKVKDSIPSAARDRALGTLGRIHRANAAFFRGQLTICLIDGAIVFVALALLGVKFSLLFGALYAVLSVVPFLGVAIGFTVTELFVLADAGGFSGTFVLVAALFVAIQVLEATVLQPLILGKETGLHPIAIILALLVCGKLFGFFGMLVAVPIVSTAKILLEDYVRPMFREVTD